MSGNPLDAAMARAVAEGVFPGGVLWVWADGAPRYEAAFGVTDLIDRQPVTPATIFDLASLTKPLATTLAAMRLHDAGRLPLDAPLGELLPDFASGPLAPIQVASLLTHQAGLMDHRPYYMPLSRAAPERRGALLTEFLRREIPQCPPGRRTRYSDIGFMLMERIVARLAGAPLDRYLAASVYGPLGLKDLFFPGMNRGGRPAAAFAATERCPWRGQVLRGRVHDENAYVMGGVAGQAGLFGTARAVGGLLAHLLAVYQGAETASPLARDTLRRFLQRPAGAPRALGFDAPAGQESSAGRYFSGETVGHLGFTGTSFWMDPARGAIVVLLTNRVHPSRANGLIRRFRPEIHDRVMKMVAKGGELMYRSIL